MLVQKPVSLLLLLLVTVIIDHHQMRPLIDSAFSP